MSLQYVKTIPGMKVNMLFEVEWTTQAVEKEPESGLNGKRTLAFAMTG